MIRGTDGLATVSNLKGQTVFEAEKISLPELARDLMRYVDLPILDMTGLKGTYQVALEVPARAAGLNVTRTVADRPGRSSTALLMAVFPADALCASRSRSPVDTLTVGSNPAVVTDIVSVAEPDDAADRYGPHSVGAGCQSPGITRPPDGV